MLVTFFRFSFIQILENRLLDLGKRNMFLQKQKEDLDTENEYLNNRLMSLQRKLEAVKERGARGGVGRDTMDKKEEVRGMCEITFHFITV